MKNFESVAAMKLATLNAGQTIHTKGFNTSGDGGGATYLTADPQAVDEVLDHTLENGNVALLQIPNSIILRSDNGTLYRVTVTDGGVLEVNPA